MKYKNQKKREEKESYTDTHTGSVSHYADHLSGGMMLDSNNSILMQQHES
jgi:peptide deformylase